ncbi:hypothetical protein CB1_000735004 [Camelus ferus]|nr:hypothetical protein CB1_000735004 [Camelus ferus]
MEQIVEGKDEAEDKMRGDQLNDQYLELFEEQRLYFKTLKEFKEEGRPQERGAAVQGESQGLLKILRRCHTSSVLFPKATRRLQDRAMVLEVALGRYKCDNLHTSDLLSRAGGAC